jgi:hypothetical protein
MLGLILLAPALAAQAERKDPPPDAELLLNLDLLKETDLAKERDLYRRFRMFESLRLLEHWQMMDSQTPAAPAQKEKR